MVTAQGNPAAQASTAAVSVNTLELATQPLAPATRATHRTPTRAHRLASPADATGTCSRRHGNVPTPDARAGTSIFIYHCKLKIEQAPPPPFFFFSLPVNFFKKK